MVKMFQVCILLIVSLTRLLLTNLGDGTCTKRALPPPGGSFLGPGQDQPKQISIENGHFPGPWRLNAGGGGGVLQSDPSQNLTLPQLEP